MSSVPSKNQHAPDRVGADGGELLRRGFAHRRRFLESGDRAELDRAIICHREAAGPPAGLPLQRQAFRAIAADLRHRAVADDDASCLLAALALLREALAKSRSACDRGEEYAEVAMCLRALWRMKPSAARRERAVHWTRRALEQTTRGTLAHRRAAYNLALVLMNTPAVSDQDLRTVVSLSETATGSGDPAVHHLLGRALHALAERSGDPALLDRAVAVHRHAVAATPAEDRRRAARIRSFTRALSARADRTGSIGDIEEAIQLKRELLWRTDCRQTTEPLVTEAEDRGSLANSLLDLYVVTAQEELATEAIWLLRETVRLLRGRPGSDLRDWLHNLGLAYLDRYGKGGDIADIDAAVAAHEEVTRQPTAPQANHLDALASALLRRCQVSGDTQALHRALIAIHSAIQRTDATDSAFSVRLGTLCNVLREVHRLWPGKPSEVVTAWIDDVHHRACIVAARLHVPNARRSAQNWAMWATDRSSWWTASRAWELMQRATAAIYRAQVTAGHTEYYLYNHRRVAALAAQAHLRAGLPHRAVVSVERGRAYLMSSPSLHADTLCGTNSWPALRDVYRKCGSDPVVHVTPAHTGGFALIIRDGDVDVIDMPVLTDDFVNEVFKQYAAVYNQAALGFGIWPRGLAATCRRLWEAVAAPLLAGLAGEERAAVIPSGLLGFLPLHTAWTADSSAFDGKRYLLDELAISFVPNARLLARSRAAARTTSVDPALVVAVSRTAGRSPLPLADLEAGLVARNLPQCVSLTSSDATAKRVLDQLSHAGVLHLVCHASQRFSEPRDGVFLLAGGQRLSVQEMMATTPARGRLAVLSGCGTALVGERLPDEALGFHTALLQAGYAGVIGNLWPVSDTASAVLMHRFYTLWRQHDVDPPEALRQAQQWLRLASVNELARILPPEVTRGLLGPAPFNNCQYWGSFVYTGA